MKYILFVLFVGLIISVFLMFLFYFITRKRSNIMLLLQVSLFLLFSTSLFGFMINNDDISKVENRKLTVWTPLNSLSVKDWSVNIEKYLNDHFLFRDYYLRLNRLVSMNIFHKSPTDRVVFGKDDWSFSKRVIDIDYNFDSKSKNDINNSGIINSIREFQKFLIGKEIELYIVITPSKPYIYPEMLPKWIDTEHNNRNTIDNFIQLINEQTSIPILDLYNDVIKEKDNSKNNLYHYTDTHWNGDGAFVASKSIINFINNNSQYLIEDNFDNYVEKHVTRETDLNRMIGDTSPVNCVQYVNPNSSAVIKIGLREYFRDKFKFPSSSNWTYLKTCYSNIEINQFVTPIIIADSFFLASDFRLEDIFSKYVSLHYNEISQGLPFIFRDVRDANILILSFVDREYDNFSRNIINWDSNIDMKIENYVWEKKLLY